MGAPDSGSRQQGGAGDEPDAAAGKGNLINRELNSVFELFGMMFAPMESATGDGSDQAKSRMTEIMLLSFVAVVVIFVVVVVIVIR